MTPAFLDALNNHPWKGNIRELKNIIERAVILAGDSSLGTQHLPQDFFMLLTGRYAFKIRSCLL